MPRTRSSTWRTATRRTCSAWLGVSTEYLLGQLLARELAWRCRRRLWPEQRNLDPPPTEEIAGRCHVFSRPAGYLRERTADLLRLAELAGDGIISWGLDEDGPGLRPSTSIPMVSSGALTSQT